MYRLLASLCFAFLLSFPVIVQAQTIAVSNAYGFETIGNATSGGFFLTIENTGDEADSLVSAALPENVAERVEIHTHITDDNGVMMMRQVPFVEIPAQSTVEFRPMSYHLMVFGLKEPFVAEHHYPITLNFEKAGAVEVEAMIKSLSKNTETKEINEPQNPDTATHEHMH
ncbi:MAG: hypothetical protein CMH30_04025 [Micavibrio sp.]|nr:hypothetical protein [Micavibrio sp.]|tara:strand:+ start:62 stop:571 length:510 start_codon:yes stop_codon:yes gene_type:complete